MQNPSCNADDGQKGRKKRKRAASARAKSFGELYAETGETLGEGAFGQVRTYVNKDTEIEYAVKRVEMTGRNNRVKVLKEIEIFYHCRGHENILQLIEYFEEGNCFYLVFEKMDGGSLLETIEKSGHLTEQEASLMAPKAHVDEGVKTKDMVRWGLQSKDVKDRSIAHRDLKPENILCVTAGQLTPAKLCDFDLGSGIQITSQCQSPITTPELQSPVGSAEFMAPEVLDVWHDQAWSYDKRCDLWSLGIILLAAVIYYAHPKCLYILLFTDTLGHSSPPPFVCNSYILLCGYPPFCGNCGQDCGWENGGSCMMCQEQLFNSIQEGTFGFPEKEWSDVSESAKDLIQHLLVRDPHLRYSAEEVLRHPWVTMESPQAQLATPRILLRNNSVRELGLFTETANAVNRLLLSHLSITEASDPPVQGHACLEDSDALDDVRQDDSAVSDVAFQFDSSSDDSIGSVISFQRQQQSLQSGDDELAGGDSAANGELIGDKADGDTSVEHRRRKLTSSNRAGSVASHRRLRETQLSGDSGFASGDTLSPFLSSLAQTPPRGASAMF